MEELDRIRIVLEEKNVVWDEKKMFGGNCFMVDDKMLMGTYRKGLMCRVDPVEVDELAEHQGAEQLIHGGRPMTGYLWIDRTGYASKKTLSMWIQKCLEFNPQAKSSKKKKKKTGK